jgi:hypothetical protein
MKKNLPEKRDLASRLTTYAASSGALIALGSTVHGQVIYSGIQNLEVNMPAEYLEIDMDGDLVNDFGFYAYGSSSQWTSGLYNIRNINLYFIRNYLYILLLSSFGKWIERRVSG